MTEYKPCPFCGCKDNPVKQNVPRVYLVTDLKVQMMNKVKSLIADLLCIDEELTMYGYTIDSPNRKTISETIEVLQQLLNKHDVIGS